MRPPLRLLASVALCVGLAAGAQGGESPGKTSPKTAKSAPSASRPKSKANARSARMNRPPNPVFAPIQDDPALPRVLLIGDSIAIDDLNAFARPRLDKIQLPHNVHFTPEGYQALAGQVAASIARALKPPIGT